MSRRMRKNPWVGITYIPDNPRMETPPAWFLQQIHDFDADLVLLPSRMIPFAYVVARRRRLSAGLTDKAIEDTIQVSDTKMCLLHGLVPVCLMYKTGPTWNADPILRSLRARDLWAQGGADAVCDRLEAEEAAAKEKLRKDTRQHLYEISGDAYRSYKARTGQRLLAGGTAAQAGRRESNSPSSGSTAGSGALSTLK